MRYVWLRSHWEVPSRNVFGIVLWTFSAIISYSLWGYFGLFFGLVWMGVGVVPVAVVAAALHGYWFLAFVILGQVILVFGSRFLGLTFITHDTPKTSATLATNLR